MAHPFQDQLIGFVGKLTRCTHSEAMDALYEVGGVPNSDVNWSARFVVAGKGAENTKAYKKFAQYRADDILTEDQFFDILEGRALLPEKVPNPNIIRIPPKDPVAAQAYEEELNRSYLHDKRIAYLRKRGIPTENGRMKIDLRPVKTLKYVIDKMNEDPTD